MLEKDEDIILDSELFEKDEDIIKIFKDEDIISDSELLNESNNSLTIDNSDFYNDSDEDIFKFKPS